MQIGEVCVTDIRHRAQSGCFDKFCMIKNESQGAHEKIIWGNIMEVFKNKYLKHTYRELFVHGTALCL